jgi:hypothetical protein
MTSVIWVPGKFSLTNRMLSNLRAAGYAKGKAVARGWTGRRVEDRFAAETRAIRLAVKVAARKAGVLRFHVPCILGFYVFGHRKADPSAWYLLGKAAEDGLVDAGVLGRDRFDVAEVRGRVLRTQLEEECEAEAWGVVHAYRPGEGPVGLLIGLVPR